MHLIPKDKSLWTLDKYEEFLDARRLLILDKLSSIIQKAEDE